MPRRSTPAPEGALYVRLPATAVARLDRAAEALGVPKKELVARLVAAHVDPDSRQGLTALGALAQPRPTSADLGAAAPTLGTYAFQPYDPPEVLTAEQTAALLQLDVRVVHELAAAGDLPGRKLGGAWRFARAAVLAWLATPERR